HHRVARAVTPACAPDRPPRWAVFRLSARLRPGAPPPPPRRRTQMTHRIGVIGGDGIGPQIVAAAMQVVRATGVAVEEVPLDLGADRYARDGHVLDDDDLATIRSCDALLKGPLGPPIGDTRVPPGTVERGII